MRNAAAGLFAVRAIPASLGWGRILRKSRLDEFPQVGQCAQGEMSIVGPRPERPHFRRLARTHAFTARDMPSLPQLTGWAQVHLEYGDSPRTRAKLEYDLYYVKHACLYLDLLTLLHTVRVVIRPKGQELRDGSCI